jgi:2-dehydro-3-deoxygluconokinase
MLADKVFRHPANMHKKYDIVSLGEAMVEFNQTDSDKPLFLQGFGGDTSNAAIAAARAGARSAYLTRLGDDTFAASLLSLWQAEGISTDGIETDPDAATGIYFVTHTENGHVFTYRRAGSAASKMTLAWLQGIPTPIIEQSKWLHLSGISLAISELARETAFAAMRIANSAGTMISFDSNLRLKLWSLERAREIIVTAIKQCDLFLPSMDDMTALTGLSEPESVVDWSHAQGAKRVVLKLGAQGALASDPDTGLRLFVDAYPTVAVDATGAGDCFCGNILARLAANDDLLSAVRYANAAASIAVQGWGAVSSLPTPKAVQARLVSTTL